MTGHISETSLLAAPFLDPSMVAVMSDEALIRRMVDVEVNLALAQAAVGLIPQEAAEEIERKAHDWMPAATVLQRSMLQNGVPVAGLARELRKRVGGTAADWVHWGATSQDILDTARVLQLAEALALLEEGLREVGAELARLAIEHRTTMMCGRTLGQAAVPTTFGYKAAGWLASLVGNLDRLEELRPRLLVVQLGGAAGTVASLGDRGPAVEAELASRLALGVPDCPWHTRRESIAELAAWLSLITGGLGKMGQDVLLLTQSEIGEVLESDRPDVGGSSAMPHKHNPVLSPRLVVAARRNAALLASAHGALLQEHERGTHGWLLEQLTVPPMVHNTAGAVRNATTLLRGLIVQEDQMARNMSATRGMLLAEAAALLLTPPVGREEAQTRVREAATKAGATGEHLADVLSRTEVPGVDWSELGDERDYLGSAEVFIDRALAAAGARGIRIRKEDE